MGLVDSGTPRFSPVSGGADQRCQETVSQGKTSSGQGCQMDRSALKSSSLHPSVKAIYRKIAVRQGVKVRSPDIFGADT